MPWWHSQSGSWTSASDESMMICSMCGLTGLYLTQLLPRLSITSSASVTNKYIRTNICAPFINGKFTPKWPAPKQTLWNNTLWHLVSRSSNKGKLWSGFIVYCLLCVWGEQSEGRHWGEERACENSVFSVTNISTSRACSINAPLYLISFINTRHRLSLDQLWSSRNLCHIDPVPA